MRRPTPVERFEKLASLVEIDELLSGIGVPILTPEEARASRERLAAEHPPRVEVSPPRVPEKFQGARYATTETRADVQGWRKARKAVREWGADVARGAPWLLALVGPHGTGKSHLVFCEVWRLWEEDRVRVPCFAWPYELVNELRYGRVGQTDSGRREFSSQEVRQAWYDTRYCVVDEVRPSSGTDFDAIEMAKFATQRYDTDRGALLTVNWSNLGDLMGAQPADRFTIVTMDGPSYRHRGGET